MARIWKLLKKSFWAWANENALEWGAALAYYTAFSIAPLLVIALTIVGFFYQADSLAYIHAHIGSLVGNNAATAITSAIRSIRSSNSGTFASVVSILVLLVGASTVFSQLQNVLNRIWGVQPKPGHFWRDLFKQRLISFAMVIGVSFVLLVSLILSAILALITDYFAYLLPGAGLFWQTLDVAVSFSLITFLFACIYRIVPDVHIDWHDVWLGAVITTLLFIAGKTALAYYLVAAGWNRLMAPPGPCSCCWHGSTIRRRFFSSARSSRNYMPRNVAHGSSRSGAWSPFRGRPNSERAGKSLRATINAR